MMIRIDVTLRSAISSPNPTSSTRSGPNERPICSSHGPLPGPAVSDQAGPAAPRRFCTASSGENAGFSCVPSPPPDWAGLPSIPCATPLLPPAAAAGATAMSASWSATPPSVMPLASTLSMPNRPNEPTETAVSSSGPERR